MSAEPETFDLLAGRDETRPQGFPIRRSKIERPSLPDETLRRDRLLDWLDTKASRRVIFVVAEAGFGKTTLLADFSRRTRVRTVWYRLDDEDTDALGFLRYLVAGCQTADPRSVQRSAALLGDSGPNAPAWEQVLDVFLGELVPLGDEPTVVILDDYHVVEASTSIRTVVERLLSRAPERFSFILSSRRAPNLAVARLRTHDEIAELGREQLRFEPSETDELFRESYHQPLERDVLCELQERTEGWAASLQLVRSAVSGRSPADLRRFIRTLSGAEGRLYDYLAEEVIGDLEPELLRFVTRIALLDEIEPEAAAVAAALDIAAARRLINESERFGLVSKGGPEGIRRLHPLVRDFLLARLDSEIGPLAIAALHREIARFLEPRSWRGAAHHYAAAGDGPAVRRVIAAAVPTIIGMGECLIAAHFVDAFPDPDPNPWLDIIRTRGMVEMGASADAVDLAQTIARSTAACGDDALEAHATLTLHLVGERSGNEALWSAPTAETIETQPLGELGAILEATRLFIDVIENGSLESCRTAVEQVRVLSHALGHRRNEGIALLNLGVLERTMNAFADVRQCGLDAVRLLHTHGSPDEEAAAHLVVASAAAHAGSWDEAQQHIDLARGLDGGCSASEARADAAQLSLLYGDAEWFERGETASESEGTGSPCLQLAQAWAAMQKGDTASAHDLLDRASRRHGFDVGYASSVLAARTVLAALELDPDLPAIAANALRRANGQQAWYWSKVIEVASAAGGSIAAAAAAVEALHGDDSGFISITAELMARRVWELPAEAAARIRHEIVRRPLRWRRALRLVVEHASERRQRLAAAELLELVGQASDIPPLRALASSSRDKRTRDLGRGLIRRLAPRVYVEDLGRIVIHVGDGVILGTEIRRRVLGLFCFLLTKSNYSATREQVLDAIWPDQDPNTATNSLNQTAYFLRRVFEPDYDDSTTAGYLHHESDVMWLDEELVRSQSAAAWSLLRAASGTLHPDDVSRVIESYKGRFALDFMYEDWATSYRESLHATYLQMVERVVARDTARGQYSRAIEVAQKAIAVDPDADEVELSLLRLYRTIGAHAAAAEQYGHYATVLRSQLGVEPPPLESL